MTNIFQILIGKWTNSPDKRHPNITLGIKYNTNKFETAIAFGKFFTDSLRCNIYEYYFQTDASTEAILFNFYKLENLLRKRQFLLVNGIILTESCAESAWDIQMVEF